MNRREFVQRLGALGVGASACAATASAEPTLEAFALQAARPDSLGFRFVDVTRASGLQFRHHNGADGGKRVLVSWR